MEELNDDPMREFCNMSSYSYFEEKNDGPIVIPQVIAYGDAVFKNFKAREVFVDGKAKGECYITIKNPNPFSISKAVSFLSLRMPLCEVGPVDIDNVLKLDYHIYIKTSDEMAKEFLINMLSSIDEVINSKNM